MSESRIAKDAVLAEFQGDDSILLDLDSKRYHRLNETAAFIWKALEAKESSASIIEKLTAEFDVTRERAESSLNQFLAELGNRGLVKGDGV